MIRLAVLKDGAVARRIRLTRFPATIGRHSECGLRITSWSVSRQHCVLSLDGQGQLHLEDLSSTNGTKLNGSVIKGKTLVHHGDVLAVGVVQFRVELAAERRSPSETLLEADRGGETIGRLHAAERGATAPTGPMPAEVRADATVFEESELLNPHSDELEPTSPRAATRRMPAVTNADVEPSAADFEPLDEP